MTTNTPTPRTDNATNLRCAPYNKIVSADFARTLERELAAVKSLLAMKNDTVNTFMEQVRKLQAENERLIAQVATLQKHLPNSSHTLFNQPY
jgi:sigma54-dependent transcription regulator